MSNDFHLQIDFKRKVRKRYVVSESELARGFLP